MSKNISIIIPVCNEKNNVPVMVNALRSVMQTLHYSYLITFVDDGSTDGTLEVIRQEAAADEHVRYISFSRNFGHQNALKAGIDTCEADCMICMDGDMQHPPDMIPEMLRLWETGYDIVYTIRKDHIEIPKMKRESSRMFYNMLNRLSDIELESGAADFRLIDQKVVQELRRFKEEDLFWRGLIKWSGYKQISIEYEPGVRKEGRTKYTYKKMMQFALRGITSFSVKPLNIAIYLGFIFSFASLLYFPYAIISYYMGATRPGWTSIIVTIAFFGGLQLMVLGIIGLYLGKLFTQSKQRPHYLIKESNLQ
ncbi:glycosyltransferase family 2 protein [soil metagenome]